MNPTARWSVHIQRHLDYYTRHGHFSYWQVRHLPLYIKLCYTRVEDLTEVLAPSLSITLTHLFGTSNSKTTAPFIYVVGTGKKLGWAQGQKVPVRSGVE